VPRQARKKSETGIYHIMVRGINRQTIFEDAEDCGRSKSRTVGRKVPDTAGGGSKKTLDL